MAEQITNGTPPELVGRVKCITMEVGRLKLVVAAPYAPQLRVVEDTIETVMKTEKVGKNKITTESQVPVRTERAMIWEAKCLAYQPETEPVALACAVHDPGMTNPIYVEGIDPNVNITCNEVLFEPQNGYMVPKRTRNGTGIRCQQPLTTESGVTFAEFQQSPSADPNLLQ